MSDPLTMAVAAELPRLLFEPSYPPAVSDDVDRAIATAGRRWPLLRPVLIVAATLVRENGVYQVPAEAME